jgi:hypothetical protein
MVGTGAGAMGTGGKAEAVALLVFNPARNGRIVSREAKTVTTLNIIEPKRMGLGPSSTNFFVDGSLVFMLPPTIPKRLHATENSRHKAA